MDAGTIDLTRISLAHADYLYIKIICGQGEKIADGGLPIAESFGLGNLAKFEVAANGGTMGFRSAIPQFAFRTPQFLRDLGIDVNSSNVGQGSVDGPFQPCHQLVRLGQRGRPFKGLLECDH
jgi:hypothetical protein